MKKWKIISFVLMLAIVALVGLYLFIFRWERVTYFEGTQDEYEALEDGDYDAHGAYYDDSCTVAGINVHGDIMTYLSEAEYAEDNVSADDILAQLEEAEDNQNIKAVILEIDSYGGMPVAAEEISNRISSMEKPVVAVIRSGGASAAYWVASATDRIFASELSDIGSIGVTMSYVDESKINEMDGYTWNSLSTGKFKDSGSDQKPLTAEERALFERDIKLTFEKFIATIAENRGLSVEKVRTLADGSTMMGKQALANGLIDEIGFMPEAEKYLKSILAVEPVVCW